MHDEELTRFVDSLAIPAERKHVVRSELADHVASAREAAVREGRDPDAAARSALGDLEALRRSLERVEPAFRITRWRAIAHGVVAGLAIAFLIDLGGVMYGVIGAAMSIAIVAVCAPRPHRSLALLRAELRAPRIRRSVPIGPMLAYAFTVHIVPMVVWLAMIGKRGLVDGSYSVEVTFAAFAHIALIWTVIAVESIRVRVTRHPDGTHA